MAAVKAAAYAARKALRVAEKADMSFLNDLVRYKRHKLALIARMSGISRDWIMVSPRGGAARNNVVGVVGCSPNYNKLS